MTEHIVVAFRMAPSTILRGPGAYLARARSMCARGEALGARLVAWSAAVFAMSFDLDSIEEAIALATSIQQESASNDGVWAAGVAEGQLEVLFPDDPRSSLAWGDALLASVSLARVAKPGEVLVDVDLRAMQEGRLDIVEIRSANDSGRRVRGWRVDLDHPWKPDADAAPPPASRAADEDASRADGEFPMDELSTAEVLEIVDSDSRPGLLGPEDDGHDASERRTNENMYRGGAVAGAFGASAGARSGNGLLIGIGPFPPSPGKDVVPGSPGAPRPPASPAPSTDGALTLARLARQVRAIALRRSSADALAALPALRRAYAEASDVPPEARCRGGLSLAVALAIGGFSDEALLEALEVLALARETRNEKAAAACLALLSKLYDSAGWPDAASRLQELALERRALVAPTSAPYGLR